MKTKMEIEDIKKCLCIYDLRNPYHSNHIKRRELCNCDNCYEGKTQLAEELLRYIEKFGEIEKPLP